jgi:outer membrane protein assembly factor BamB
MVPATGLRRCDALVLFFLIVAAGRTAHAQEWTRFRGPNGSGLSDTKSIPVEWTEKDFLWKVPVPGVGHSSPVLWGDRLFLTAGEKETGKRIVLGIDAATGKTVWTQTFPARRYKMHQRNSIATATPAVDAQRLYVSWATPDKYTVSALDHNGNPRWEADLGPYKSAHGFGVSLIVHDDLVLAGNDQDGGGSLVALEAATGQVRWRVPRKPKNATYSTPCIYRPNQGSSQAIFTNWQHGITAVDLKAGKVAWEISVFDTKRQERSVASPVVAGNLILGTCGFATGQKHMVAIDPAGSADGKPREVWRMEKSVSYLPTPLVKGARVYACSEQGIASCLDLATGKVIWQERVPGSFSASPICVGDRIYCVSNEGDVLVLAAADQFRLVARNKLGERCQSTPAVAGGRLYVRTSGHLIAIGRRQ